MKEICTFKPQINTINKKILSNTKKIELPKHKKNKSANLYNNSITQENTNINNNNNKDYDNGLLKQNTLSNQTEENNNINIYNNSNGVNEKNLKKYNNHNYRKTLFNSP